MNLHVLTTQQRFLLITRAINTVDNANKSIRCPQLQYFPLHNILHDYKILSSASSILSMHEMKQQ